MRRNPGWLLLFWTGCFFPVTGANQQLPATAQRDVRGTNRLENVPFPAPIAPPQKYPDGCLVGTVTRGRLTAAPVGFARLRFSAETGELGGVSTDSGGEFELCLPPDRRPSEDAILTVLVSPQKGPAQTLKTLYKPRQALMLELEEAAP